MIDIQLLTAENKVDDVGLVSGRVVPLRHANAGVFALNLRLQQAIGGVAGVTEPSLDELRAGLRQVLPDATDADLDAMPVIAWPMLLAAACGKAVEVNDVLVAWAKEQGGGADDPPAGAAGKAPAPRPTRGPRRGRTRSG